MKKNILLNILFFCAVLASSAQITFQIACGGTGMDAAERVMQTKDGGYVIESQTVNFGPGTSNLYLMKTDSTGVVVWEKTYGGSADNFANSLDQTYDDGYIIGGGSSSFGAGGYDVYLVKVNSNGDTLWTSTIGGASDDYAYDVSQTNDSGLIIVGTTISFGSGGIDVYLIKTNSVGDTVWTKTFGGTGDDVGFGVNQTNDGGYIIVGYTTSFGISADNVYLIKTDADGNMQWSKTYGGAGSERGFTVHQTTNDGYIVSGYTSSFGKGGTDAYLLKTDSLGNLLWSKAYGGTSNDAANGMKQTPDGGYVFAGNTANFGAGLSDAWLIKTDSNGDTLWTRTYGSTLQDIGTSVALTSDGGYIVAGSTRSYGVGVQDVYLIKTDANGHTACNENGTALIITSPATLTTSPATLTMDGTSAVVTTPPSDLSGGGAEASICLGLNLRSIQENNGSSIFPNPANNEFSIRNNKLTDKNISVSISNVLGEIVFSGHYDNVTGGDLIIDVHNLMPGIYFVKMESKNDIVTKQLVKE